MLIARIVIIVLQKTVFIAVYYFARLIVLIFSKLFLDLRIKYLSPLPKGAKIFVINHPTTIDPFLILLLNTEVNYVLIWNKIFNVPLLGFFLKFLKHIPVDFDNGRTAYEKSREYLKQGKNLVIFPEGDLSATQGCFSMIKSGAVRLSIDTATPIIPVGISINPNQIKYYHARVEEVELNSSLYSGPYSIAVGKAIHFTEHDVKQGCEIVNNKINNLIRTGKLTTRPWFYNINVKYALNKASSFFLYQTIFLINFVKW